MRPICKLACAALACPLLAPVGAAAQWPTEPTTNLAIADASQDQVLPLVAATSDGGCYVGWFDGSGSFEVYLQRLDAAGNEQWAHKGILISDHSQNSALFGWHLIADSSDNCVLVFSDERDGGDLDIHAYKIHPNGQMLWGDDGVTLSNNADFEPAPRVAQAANGDFVFVWSRLPASGDGDIRMQRLTSVGAPLLAAGGLPVIAAPGEDPAFPQVVPGAGNDVILTYVRDISTFASPRHVRTARFDAGGTMIWGPVQVYDAFSIPIGYAPGMIADGSGGAVIYWHRSDGAFFNSFVQRLNSAGTEKFAHNGVAVSTTANMHHLDPAVAFQPDVGDSYVFWNQRNSAQTQWGINVQRITSAGARALGSGGVALLPVNSTFKSPPRAVPTTGGAIALLADEPSSGFDRVIAMRVDNSGDLVWGGSPVEVSTAMSGKSRLPVAALPGGGLVAVWEDDRAGDVDIYGQAVQPNGTLGSFNPGDFDGDGDVDLDDYQVLFSCVTGPGTHRPPATCSASDYQAADFNGDNDVDLEDFHAFVQMFVP